MLKILRQRKTYTSCNDLPLHNFIKIVVHGDLSYLYAEPAKFIHRQADLSAIWEVIFNEYNELTNNTNSKHVFSLIREITYINGKLEIIQQCVDTLAKHGSKDFPKLCDLLRATLNVTFTYSDETLINDLERTVKRAKTYLMQRSQLTAEYTDLTKDNSQKTTEQDYLELITQLSKYMGFQINLHKTTVSLYISYINQFKAENG